MRVRHFEWQLEADDTQDDQSVISESLESSKPFIPLEKFLLFRVVISPVSYNLHRKLQRQGTPFHAQNFGPSINPNRITDLPSITVNKLKTN